MLEQRGISEKKHVVLMGGWSSEREISLRSGENVYRAMKNLGFDVIAYDVTRETVKHIGELGVDMAFIALHGAFGEDGCIQGMLECLGISYTGSGVAASAVSMDKILTKKILAASGLPVAKHVEMNLSQREEIEKLGFPMVLKAVSEGSSVGVELIRDKSELDHRLPSFIQEFPRSFAESYVAGREMTIGVIRNKQGLKAFPILELKPKKDFYDYEAKYTEGMTDFIIPANISNDLRDRLWALAKKAYEALGLAGVARIDVIVDADQRPWILEANTIPGMTATSDIPAMAAAEGLSMETLVLDILESAL